MIDVIKGDMFVQEAEAGNALTFRVIPTNVGWKYNGVNVMGRGLAKQASSLFPDLARRYGHWCMMMGSAMYIDMEYQVICLPSKELNTDNPHLSWQGKADEDTVSQSYDDLWYLAKKWFAGTYRESLIKCPLLGIGNGKLSRKKVLDIVNRYSWNDNIQFYEL